MCTVWFPLPHVTATIPDEEQAMSFAAPAADAIPLSIAVELARNQSVSALLPTPGLLGTAPVAVTVAVSITHTTHTHTCTHTHTTHTHMRKYRNGAVYLSCSNAASTHCSPSHSHSHSHCNSSHSGRHSSVTHFEWDVCCHA